jgi:hypothetical protein
MLLSQMSQRLDVQMATGSFNLKTEVREKERDEALPFLPNRWKPQLGSGS